MLLFPSFGGETWILKFLPRKSSENVGVDCGYVPRFRVSVLIGIFYNV
jgi:hypothetical protein